MMTFQVELVGKSMYAYAKQSAIESAQHYEVPIQYVIIGVCAYVCVYA